MGPGGPYTFHLYGTFQCLSKSISLRFSRISPRHTSPEAWLSLVQLLTMTGSSSLSERSNASRVISLADCWSHGSSTGSPAHSPANRESCSLLLYQAPGSSATTMTRPPRTPV